MTVRRPRLVPQASRTGMAAYWLARHEVAPETAQDPIFLAWLAAAPENQAAWDRAQRLWADAASTLADHPLSEALRASARASRPERWPTLAAAACLAVAAVGGGAYLATQTPSRDVIAAGRDPMSRLGQPDLVTARGGRLTTQLADGTQLELDTDTAVDVAIDGQRRRLRLVRGQAFVTVAADGRPFSVEAGGQTIVDRGTAFAVRLEAATVSVVLQNGQVAIGPTGASATRTLSPGQRAVVRPGRAVQIQAIDPDAVLAWREGFIQFSDTPLAEAVAELNRYGGQRLVIRDPKVAVLQTSGRFRLGDPARFVRNAAEVLPIRGVASGEDLEIRAIAPG